MPKKLVVLIPVAPSEGRAHTDTDSHIVAADRPALAGRLSGLFAALPGRRREAPPCTRSPLTPPRPDRTGLAQSRPPGGRRALRGERPALERAGGVALQPHRRARPRAVPAGRRPPAGGRPRRRRPRHRRAGCRDPHRQRVPGVARASSAPGVGLRDASGDGQPASAGPSSRPTTRSSTSTSPSRRTRSSSRSPRAPPSTQPIVVRHTITGTDVLAAPQLSVDAGRGSQVVVIEVFESDARHHRPERAADPAAGRAGRPPHPHHGPAARPAHVAARQPDLHGRARTPPSSARPRCSAATTPACAPTAASWAGAPPATCWPAYFGEADQHLDFRTFQDHRAPDTTSNLLFKGAVGGHSRSVYTGLIRVRKEARGTNAFQTNRNLKLSDARLGRVGAEPGDREQRRALQPRLDRRPDRRRAALLPREPGRAAGRRPSGWWSPASSTRCWRRIPVPVLRDHIRAEIAAKLDRAAEDGAIGREVAWTWTERLCAVDDIAGRRGPPVRGRRPPHRRRADRRRLLRDRRHLHAPEHLAERGRGARRHPRDRVLEARLGVLARRPASPTRCPPPGRSRCSRSAATATTCSSRSPDGRAGRSRACGPASGARRSCGAST